MAELVLPKGVSQEDIKVALALLAKKKEGIQKRKEKLNDPAYKAKRAEALLFKATDKALLLEKAKAAGITNTEQEIRDNMPRIKATLRTRAPKAKAV